MRNKCLLALLVIACVTLMSGIGFASACPAGTLADYTGQGFSCTIGDKTFGGWVYEGSANPPSFALPAAA